MAHLRAAVDSETDSQNTKKLQPVDADAPHSSVAAYVHRRRRVLALIGRAAPALRYVVG